MPIQGLTRLALEPFIDIDMVTDSKTAWELKRPVLARLPAKGYQDNPIADSLTTWVDEKLSTKKDQLESFHLELDPDTCQDASLDYLAWLVGLSGSYYDTQWSTDVKRDMIRASMSFLWKNRGTLAVIKRVLSIHNINHSIYQDGDLRLTFPIGAEFGTARLRVLVRLPITYHRAEAEFREAERTLRNYAPAVIQSKVVYNQFYLGISSIGDSLFT